MKFVSNSRRLLEELKAKLSATFDVESFDSLMSYVGLEINKDGTGILQKRYMESILEKHGLREANGAWTPLPSEIDLTSPGPNDVLLSKLEHKAYRAMIDELLYLAVCTRPDLSFAVGVLARRVYMPTRRHIHVVRCVLRYVSGTRDLGIKYHRGIHSGGDQILEAFADSDWAGDQETRKSTTGYVVMLKGSPVAWKSQRQSVTALSSAEAEYVSLSTCGKNLVWIHRLVCELFCKRPFEVDARIPTICLWIGNTAAMSLASNDQISAKSKHIEVRYH